MPASFEPQLNKLEIQNISRQIVYVIYWNLHRPVFAETKLRQGG